MSTEELFELLRGGGEFMVVESTEFDPSTDSEIKLYLFEIESSRGAAGGRAGGFGSRRIASIRGYTVRGFVSHKFFETRSEDVISRFDLPYHATAMDFPLPDGSTVVVRGVVDSDLTSQYDSLVGF